MSNKGGEYRVGQLRVERARKWFRAEYWLLLFERAVWIL